jgi:adenylate cyclase
MKYRTKLYVAFIAVAMVSAVLALGISYFEAKRFLFSMMQSKIKSVVATTAAMIDPELLKQIKTSADENSPAYKEVQAILRKARDANRRDYIYVKFVYTMRPSPTNPSQLVYVVDAEENPKDVSHVGDLDENSIKDQTDEHLYENYSPDHFITDTWGIWLSGFAPVYDKEGTYVGTVGGDLRAIEVINRFHKILIFEIPAFLGSICLAVIMASFLSRRASSSLSTICSAVKEIGKGNFNQEVNLKTHDEFEEVGTAINAMEQGLKERERIKKSFASYVSRQIFEKILTSESVTKLEGERKKVTVLFSDIHHFTTLSERLVPEQVVSILNEYFEQMLDVIFTHQGTLDKFLGDGIMVEFGAPLDDPQQERNAVLAAIDMQKALKKLNAKWAQKSSPLLEMSIGIHTGQAVVGNVGSEQRMEYTAIGDTVNVASRLEQAAKGLDVSILISDTTYQALKGEFLARNLGPLALPGRKEEVISYAIDIPEKS